jgi:hypothetical protein
VSSHRTVEGHWQSDIIAGWLLGSAFGYWAAHRRSLFYAGKIAPHLGAMAQLTYANDSGTIGIDNTDLRFAWIKILPKVMGGKLCVQGPRVIVGMIVRQIGAQH